MVSNKNTEPSDIREQTRESLECQAVLSMLACQARTVRGKVLLTAMDLMGRAQQEAHFQRLFCWRDWLETNKPLAIPETPDPDFFNRNPHLDPFDAEELRGLRDVLQFWGETSAREDLAFARDGLEQVPEVANLEARMKTLFERDGSWRPDVTPVYAGLHRQMDQTLRRVDQVMSQAVSKYGAWLNETIVFERNRRKVLAVKLDFKGKVSGILQDYSASGNTVYVEPQEAVQPQNKIRQLLAEIQEELWRLRCELTATVLENTLFTLDICPLLAHMDRMQALARVARENRCQIVRPNEGQLLSLLEARHPFLDEAFAPLRQAVREHGEPDTNRMVPFNLKLDGQRRGMVISGANTGGKTVTLKTSGLLAWMANSGLPIPAAEGSEVPFYSAIMADIGDHQSLSHNLSTFASHLKNMRAILEEREDRALVLLDELGSGTDPQEGNALAQALIEALLERGFHLIVTTHQQILCTLALNHPHLENGSMVFDAQTLTPTYRFNQGVPGRSHALEIAAKAGFPAQLLERAASLVDERQLDIQAAIQQLQNQAKQMHQQKRKLRREELKLHRQAKEAREEAASLRQIQKDQKEKARLRLTHTIEKVENELRAVLNTVQERGTKRTGITEFAKVKKAVLEPFQAEVEPTGFEGEISGLPPNAWKPGDLVLLHAWRRKGTLVDVDRKRARIDCDGKLVTANVDEVTHLKPLQKTEPQTRVSHDDEVDTVPFELRLLGFRVEEALEILDRTVDRALRRGNPFLKVIHGHGTGALKQAVRAFLNDHLAKSRFRVLTGQENDGVTEINFIQ